MEKTQWTAAVIMFLCFWMGFGLRSELEKRKIRIANKNEPIAKRNTEMTEGERYSNFKKGSDLYCQKCYRRLVYFYYSGAYHYKICEECNEDEKSTSKKLKS